MLSVSAPRKESSLASVWCVRWLLASLALWFIAVLLQSLPLSLRRLLGVSLCVSVFSLLVRLPIMEFRDFLNPV